MMSEIDKYRDEIPKEETFDEEQFRISEEAIDRMKKDRDDDYSYEPSDAIIGGIERSLKRKLKDKTHK